MPDELSVNTDAMMNIAPEFQELARRVGNIGSALKGQQQAIGNPFGPELKAVETNYSGSAQNLEEGVDGLGQGLNQAYENFVTMAQVFNTAEEENKDSIVIYGDGSDPVTSNSGSDDSGYGSDDSGHASGD
jgi:uncharacterized protein YukE